MGCVDVKCYFKIVLVEGNGLVFGFFFLVCDWMRVLVDSIVLIKVNIEIIFWEGRIILERYGYSCIFVYIVSNF